MADDRVIIEPPTTVEARACAWASIPFRPSHGPSRPLHTSRHRESKSLIPHPDWWSADVFVMPTFPLLPSPSRHFFLASVELAPGLVQGHVYEARSETGMIVETARSSVCCFCPRSSSEEERTGTETLSSSETIPSVSTRNIPESSQVDSKGQSPKLEQKRLFLSRQWKQRAIMKGGLSFYLSIRCCAKTSLTNVSRTFRPHCNQYSTGH